MRNITGGGWMVEGCGVEATYYCGQLFSSSTPVRCVLEGSRELERLDQSDITKTLTPISPELMGCFGHQDDQHRQLKMRIQVRGDGAAKLLSIGEVEQDGWAGPEITSCATSIIVKQRFKATRSSPVIVRAIVEETGDADDSYVVHGNVASQ